MNEIPICPLAYAEAAKRAGGKWPRQLVIEKVEASHDVIFAVMSGKDVHPVVVIEYETEEGVRLPGHMGRYGFRDALSFGEAAS